MLSVPEYAERWQQKLSWYAEQDIAQHADGGGTGGTLIVTEDDANGGISSAAIRSLSEEVF
jgi:hypothetical protein